MAEDEIMKTGPRLASCPARKFTSLQTRRDQGGSSVMSRVKGLSAADRERYFLAFRDERYQHEKELVAYHMSEERIERWEKLTGLRVARDGGQPRFTQDGPLGGFYLSVKDAEVYDALYAISEKEYNIRTNSDALFNHFYRFKETVHSSLNHFAEKYPGTFNVTEVSPPLQIRDDFNNEGIAEFKLHFTGESRNFDTRDILKDISKDPNVRLVANQYNNIGVTGRLMAPEVDTLELSFDISKLARSKNPIATFDAFDAAPELESGLASIGF